MKQIGKIIFISVIMAYVFISESFTYKCSASDSEKYMKYSDFVGTVLKNIKGKTDCENNYISFKLKKNGSIILQNNTIGSERVKKCMKKYDISRADAQYMIIAEELGIIEKKDVRRADSLINCAQACSILSNADELLYGCKFDETEIEFVIINRLTDCSSIKDEDKRKSVAKAYMNGFIRGKSSGEYSHIRAIYPKKKLKKTSLLKMIQMLNDKSLRYSLSDDYQITRNKNLPRNADLYPYIIDSFPNAYYETGFSCLGVYSGEKFLELQEEPLKNRVKKNDFGFVFPFEVSEFNSLIFPDDFNYEGREYNNENRNGDLVKNIVESSVEFYEKAFNVDYRTIAGDTEWQKVMIKYLGRENMEKYMTDCINNKTVIECDCVAADMSAVYWFMGKYNCKVYAHIRIVSDRLLENGMFSGSDEEEHGYLYPVIRNYEAGTANTRIVFGPTYMDYRLGEWTDFYVNTRAASDTYGNLGDSLSERGIMIDYTGIYPWLIRFPFLKKSQ